jgi:hypothetical protein
LAGRALDFHDDVDTFVCHYRDLRSLELSDEDWHAISQVTQWLKAFRSATVAMSQTKEPMLSTVHAIFHGLQDHIRSILRELPDTISPELKAGLVAAHSKLSDYY